MNSDRTDATNEGAEQQPAPAGSDDVRATLIARLTQIRPVPMHVRPPQSMQPTPEAAKTRAARLRRKRRILLQKSKFAEAARSGAIPPAPDALAP
jgi:hypothetical protein